MARPRLSAKTYIDGILAGNRVILSQAITLIESNLDTDNILAQEVLQAIISHTGKSLRIGITGVPGVGKSTFIESFGGLFTHQNKKIAVLAIDPTSQISGGSIMGDKTRMENLSIDKNAYIRPTPAGNSLGGVARKTRETMLLCEAAGFEIILVETVGVGQSEIAVKQMTDFFLLLMLAGAGDELQGVKRGIMEVADALVITKSDGENQKHAYRAKIEYENALHLFPSKENKWIPPVLTCAAIQNQGMNEVLEMIEKYVIHTKNNNFFYQQRENQNLYWLHQNIKDVFEERFYQHINIKKSLKEYENNVKNGHIPPWQAAKDLWKIFENNFD
ncbi:MAG: methylmalonyl Co-A mutase-associated GTPase MeaB [Bacteroidetes bacterium]|nr:MAG: methylmalonyl Co-A mutase-associated GTPase MeaB [Bacteroidota bacterium]TAG90634.1 MAG: methylmalonyl Co-A mutase-associated GTPase MeaB [Bacteroidota bacterium]